MISIAIDFGSQSFNINEIRGNKFKFSSSSRSYLTSSIDEAFKASKYELNREIEQIREWNEEFAGYPDMQISEFRIADELTGLVNLDRMKFEAGVYIGNEPYSTTEF